MLSTLLLSVIKSAANACSNAPVPVMAAISGADDGRYLGIQVAGPKIAAYFVYRYSDTYWV